MHCCKPDPLWTKRGNEERGRRKRGEEGRASNLFPCLFLSMALPHCLGYPPSLFQQGSFSFLTPNIPASSFLFQAMCMALPMPHPPFSLHAVSLYPWQPMISFSPELGARPQARRGVFARVMRKSCRSSANTLQFVSSFGQINSLSHSCISPSLWSCLPAAVKPPQIPR